MLQNTQIRHSNLTKAPGNVSQSRHVQARQNGLIWHSKLGREMGDVCIGTQDTALTKTTVIIQ